VEAGRRDRVLYYLAFLALFELVAALYIMVDKPDLVPAVVVAVAAAVLAALPVGLVLRRYVEAPSQT
jgi:hypothetical protein